MASFDYWPIIYLLVTEGALMAHFLILRITLDNDTW